MALRNNLNDVPPAYEEGYGAVGYPNPTYNPHMNIVGTRRPPAPGPPRPPAPRSQREDPMHALGSFCNEGLANEEESELSRLEKSHFDLNYKKIFVEPELILPNKLKQMTSKFHLLLGYASTVIMFSVYFILVVFGGSLIAIVWGCIGGLLMFIRSWIISPSVKIVVYSVAMGAPFFIQPLRAVLMPLVDIAAYPFRHIKIKHDLNGGLLLPLAAQNQQGALGNEAP